MVYPLNSNTTLVKVKSVNQAVPGATALNSNTTLVKVKYNSIIEMQYFKHNSNTTLVKVKFIFFAQKYLKLYIQIQLLLKLNGNWKVLNRRINQFKYNSC